MATVLNTLYPPLIDTFMPAFEQSGPAIVNFSLSPYNANLDINRIHISLVFQKSNLNAIAANSIAAGLSDNTAIVNGIWIVDINDTKYISKDSETEIFTLKIPRDILRTGAANKIFGIDGYYKLQLRFDSSNATISPEYLNDQRNFFSEWSSVCLLKAIPQLSLQLVNFDIKVDGTTIIDTEQPEFNAGIVPITGEVIFENNLSGKDAETLRSYQIKIYPKNNPEEIIDSTGVIFTGDSVDLNHINWLADCERAIPRVEYEVWIKIITKNQYSTIKTYNFTIFNYDSTPFTPVWTFNRVNLEHYNITNNGKIITEEDGIVKFNISAQEIMPPGFLYIKRATSLDNYKKWELISCTAENGTVNRNFEDMTVGSLVRYKYSAQYQLKKGGFTKSYYSSDVVYPDFYDMLFMRQGRQLAVRFDQDISSLRPTVNRQKIDTLGGKYPKFAENARMNYKVYNISGYIDAESDFNRKFLSDLDYREEMSNYDKEIGGKYEVRNDTIADETYSYAGQENIKLVKMQKNTVHDLYPKDNWWLQREFREQAMQWLNDGEPKLFRSMPEGNMVVMLTDISLTPNKTIGRRIYKFSATMYEIEDGYSLETLSSLGIINIRNDKNNIEKEDTPSEHAIPETTVGQLYSQYMSPAPGDGASVIKGSMDKGACGLKGFDYRHISIEDLYNYIIYESDSTLGMKYQIVPNSIVLRNLKLEFESKPQWYSFNGNSIELVNASGVTNTTTLALGYKIQITTEDNVSDIFVNEKGFYQVPTNQKVIGLKIYDGAIATINYQIDYQKIYNDNLIAQKTQLAAALVGQLSGQWDPGTYVSPLLKKKYEWIKYGDSGKIHIWEQFRDWTALSLEITPYTIVALKFSKETTYENHLVGQTGIYNLMDDTPMQEMFFLGRRMIRAESDNRPYLDEWEFILDDSAKIDKSNFYNLTWHEFINHQIEKTETLVNINDKTTTQNNEGINRLWNNNNNMSIPELSGYDITSIKNPQYNTIYGIKTNNQLEYYIYYIDNNWYPVEFWDNDQTIVLAKVPVHGMINYRGNVVRQTF